MLKDPGSLIARIENRFSDRRTDLAEITLEESGGALRVSGRVLDARTQSAVLAELHSALPGIFLEDKLQALRESKPLWVNVAVNLTGLYAQPSWLAEMLTQDAYGASVEVLEQKEAWMFVRQPDGYLGWMFKDYLSPVEMGAGSHRVCVSMMLVREQPDEAALITARLPEGVELVVSSKSGEWMQVEPHPGNLPCGMPGGWAKAAELQEVTALPGSTGEKRQTILHTAHGLLGVPYLWGGTTANGIDCSGLAQLCYRMAGVTLTRDADMQMTEGRPLKKPQHEGDLLFFCSEEDRSRVSHVAISLGGWRVIHSSRRRNGVAVDDVQTVSHLRNTYIGACSYFDSES